AERVRGEAGRRAGDDRDGPGRRARRFGLGLVEDRDHEPRQDRDARRRRAPRSPARGPEVRPGGAGTEPPDLLRRGAEREEGEAQGEGGGPGPLVRAPRGGGPLGKGCVRRNPGLRRLARWAEDADGEDLLRDRSPWFGDLLEEVPERGGVLQSRRRDPRRRRVDRKSVV